MWFVWLLLGLMGLGLLSLAGLIGLILLPSYVVLPPLRRCEYKRAEWRARKLLWLPAGDLLLAIVLLHADRLDEADAMLRDLMERADMGGHARCYLLQFRGELDDAEQLALHVLTKDTAVPEMRTVLIQAQLLKGDARPSHLQTIDQLLDEEENYIDELTNPDQHAELWSLRAWANALLGEVDAAREDIQHALDELPEGNRQAESHTHWRIGLALRHLGDETRASEHLRVAAEADPGAQGRVAREALEAVAG